MENNLWWKSGVIYQIYPRSFLDTNNDGIGDINGIIKKLDYIAGLGMDGFWLSPVYQSPMYDFGYDISDYRKIDPQFGENSDFERLISEAHKRNLKIIMDLVVNHTSHLHQWFVESRSSLDNPKRNWYIWHDGEKGRPPNNWKSVFGGSAWEIDEITGQYYLHKFLKEQPDLNWRNPEVKLAVSDEIVFWLDKGIDGFRLDVANCYIKDDELRDNPFTIGPTPRPYDMQKHIYDIDQPETHDILRYFRKLINSCPGVMLVGEIMTAYPGDPKLAASYLGDGEDELHLTFDFSLLFKKWGSGNMLEALENWYSEIPEKGWPAIALSNHDVSRHFTRFNYGKEGIKRAKIAAAFLLTVKGTPFLYYGEEIGMSDTPLKKSEIIDPVGKKYWPFNKGRDPQRTPMQWNSGENAGFSKVKPWLPLNGNYLLTNIEKESQDANSMLNFYKKLIDLRKKKVAINSGTWESAKAGKNILAYYRKKDKQKIFVALNFSKNTQRIHVNDNGSWKVLFSTHKNLLEDYFSLNFRMMPYEVSILEEINHNEL